MGLSASEKKMLERLQAKAEEPDAPPVGRTLNASIDLGDPKQVALAQKFGFLTADEVEDDIDGDDDNDDDKGDETPKRRGYFNDSK